MAIGNRQIGWSQESNLLWNISAQIQKLISVISKSLAPKYKVYTALLTQSGDRGNIDTICDGELIVGVTYYINNNVNGDFTNVGAPNNTNGTYFIATGTTPNSWGLSALCDTLTFVPDAPVVTVLENTIGNIWFTYDNPGYYEINSDGLFIIDKTWGNSNFVYDLANGIYQPVFVNVSSPQGADLPNIIQVRTVGGDYNGDSLLNNTPIEIRVYN